MSPVPSDGSAGRAVEAAFRDAHGTAVATLVRTFRDIDVAEEAVQDAFAVATSRWVAEGIPPNPAGWIVMTARNRAVDALRRKRRGKELELAAADGPTESIEPALDLDQAAIEDDMLRLMFTCCHPALRPDHQVALTLRLLGGLSVSEISRAFMVSEAAMAKRLVRVKYKIRAASIPYRVPTAAELPRRIPPVLAVVYLIYNAGADDPERASLRGEAIRLGRLVVRLMPDDAEAAGLLAMMLLSESRAVARMVDGDLVRLSDQDRGLWDRTLIGEALSILQTRAQATTPGPYRLQAAIQAVHAEAASVEATDWPLIVALYDRLLQVAPTPVVRLNRTIAAAETRGPERALEELNTLEAALAGYHLLHAARAAMLERLGQWDEAGRALTLAVAQAPDGPARRLLARERDRVLAAASGESVSRLR